MPDRDLAELAVRLRQLKAGHVKSVERDGSPAAATMSEGDQRDFTITNLEDGSPRPITATLQVVSDNAYWFVEDAVTLPRQDLARAAAIYEERVRPAVTGTLGDIANPGLDGDPRLFIIHAALDGAAGYFGSKDSYSSEVHPHSNESEIIYLDTRAAQHGIDTHLAIIAHELQHAAHFDKDVGEESWVNEGLSEVATQLAGYTGAVAARLHASPEHPTQLLARLPALHVPTLRSSRAILHIRRPESWRCRQTCRSRERASRRDCRSRVVPERPQPYMDRGICGLGSSQLPGR